jgi:hypothetical protein
MPAHDVRNPLGLCVELGLATVATRLSFSSLALRRAPLRPALRRKTRETSRGFRDVLVVSGLKAENAFEISKKSSSRLKAKYGL